MKGSLHVWAGMFCHAWLGDLYPPPQVSLAVVVIYTSGGTGMDVCTLFFDHRHASFGGLFHVLNFHGLC